MSITKNQLVNLLSQLPDVDSKQLHDHNMAELLVMLQNRTEVQDPLEEPDSQANADNNQQAVNLAPRPSEPPNNAYPRDDLNSENEDEQREPPRHPDPNGKNL